MPPSNAPSPGLTPPALSTTPPSVPCPPAMSTSPSAARPSSPNGPSASMTICSEAPWLAMALPSPRPPGKRASIRAGRRPFPTPSPPRAACASSPITPGAGTRLTGPTGIRPFAPMWPVWPAATVSPSATRTPCAIAPRIMTTGTEIRSARCSRSKRMRKWLRPFSCIGAWSVAGVAVFHGRSRAYNEFTIGLVREDCGL